MYNGAFFNAFILFKTKNKTEKQNTPFWKNEVVYLKMRDKNKSIQIT